MATLAARVVQLTDTHFSARLGMPAEWPATRDWLLAAPPDLVVHTGDIVLGDPDDENDRAFAGELLEQLPAPLLAVPGNHDAGFYGEDADRPRRLDAFRHAWGDDRFVVGLAGWRLVGVNCYLLGDAEHDAWLADAVDSNEPVAVFIHQPIVGEPADGWETPRPAAEAFRRATVGADVEVIASGHRHRSAHLGRAVWAPSLTIPGDDWGEHPSDPRCGLVEHRLDADGGHRHRTVRPWQER